jgi:hypothetical protein
MIGARGEILQWAEVGQNLLDDCGVMRREPSKFLYLNTISSNFIGLYGDRISSQRCWFLQGHKQLSEELCVEGDWVLGWLLLPWWSISTKPWWVPVSCCDALSNWQSDLPALSSRDVHQRDRCFRVWDMSCWVLLFTSYTTECLTECLALSWRVLLSTRWVFFPTWEKSFGVQVAPKSNWGCHVT